METLTPSEQRQAWLEAGVKALRPMFEKAGKPVPQSLRVSMGWSTSGKRALGSCYRESASEDAHREIFISPVMNQSSRILGTLAHELCHAALPDGVAHGKEFIHLGHGIGLVGKPTNLGEGGPAFQWFIDTFVKNNGDYPSGAILDTGKGRAGKQKTAMLKMECLDCGYICRTTAKWIEDIGAPICPCNNQPMELG